MSSLIVVAFEGQHRAAEVLSQLERLQEPATFELEDALAVYRTKHGHMRVDRAMNPTAQQGGAFGGVIGALVGAIVALPFTAGGSVAVAASAIAANATMLGAFGAGVAAEDARTFENQHGIPTEFAREISARLRPGDSAILAKGNAADPIAIAKHFRGYGGTVLSTTLSQEKAATIQRVLRG